MRGDLQREGADYSNTRARHASYWLPVPSNTPDFAVPSAKIGRVDCQKQTGSACRRWLWWWLEYSTPKHDFCRNAFSLIEKAIISTRFRWWNSNQTCTVELWELVASLLMCSNTYFAASMSRCACMCCFCQIYSDVVYLTYIYTTSISSIRRVFCVLGMFGNHPTFSMLHWGIVATATLLRTLYRIQTACGLCAHSFSSTVLFAHCTAGESGWSWSLSTRHSTCLGLLQHLWGSAPANDWQHGV